MADLLPPFMCDPGYVNDLLVTIKANTTGRGKCSERYMGKPIQRKDRERIRQFL